MNFRLTRLCYLCDRADTRLIRDRNSLSFPSVLQESRPLGATLISDCVTLTGCEDEDQDSGVAKVKILNTEVDCNRAVVVCGFLMK